MANSTLLQVRTDAEDKERASAILEQLGTNLSAVVNMLIRQIILTESIPFDVKLPRADAADLFVTPVTGTDFPPAAAPPAEKHKKSGRKKSGKKGKR